MIAIFFLSFLRSKVRTNSEPSPQGKGVFMTTRYEKSSAIQGKGTDISLVPSLPYISDAVSDSGSALGPTKSKPKRKRGRPRKIIPLDAFEPDHQSALNSPLCARRGCTPPSSKKVSRSRTSKKNCTPTDFFEDDFFDTEVYGGDTPFVDDELSTLEEFEKMSKVVGRSARLSTNRIAADEKIIKQKPRVKKSKRRRFIDPATCERDYSSDEIEFMNALNEYKMSSGRMFPTCSEILEVLRDLGYEKK